MTKLKNEWMNEWMNKNRNENDDLLIRPPPHSPPHPTPPSSNPPTRKLRLTDTRTKSMKWMGVLRHNRSMDILAIDFSAWTDITMSPSRFLSLRVKTHFLSCCRRRQPSNKADSAKQKLNKQTKSPQNEDVLKSHFLEYNAGILLWMSYVTLRVFFF